MRVWGTALVFAAELDRLRHPARTRLWGMGVGSLLLGFVTVALVSPRTLAVTVPAFVIAALISSMVRGTASGLAAKPGAAASVLSLFAGYALLSTLWAAEPARSVSSPVVAVLALATGLFGVKLMRRETRPNAYHIAEGLWIGLAAGLVYLLAELLSDQAIKIFVYNTIEVPKSWLTPPQNFRWRGDKIAAINEMDLTRSIAPVTLLLWSALLALEVTAPRRAVRIAQGVLFALALAVIALSGHETSKAAIAASAPVFLLARWRAEWVRRLLQVGVVAACALVVPLSLGLYKAGLHKAPFVQHSLQHRFAIWNYTAEETLKRPLLGVGAGMMYHLDELRPVYGDDTRFDVKVPHAHNIFLQTWYELGIVGAVLLAAAGLSLIERIRQLSGSSAHYGYALFTSALVMGAASYGMWQPWFLMLFALAAICYAIALRVRSEGDA